MSSLYAFFLPFNLDFVMGWMLCLSHTKTFLLLALFVFLVNYEKFLPFKSSLLQHSPNFLFVQFWHGSWGPSFLLYTFPSFFHQSFIPSLRQPLRSPSVRFFLPFISLVCTAHLPLVSSGVLGIKYKKVLVCPSVYLFALLRVCLSVRVCLSLWSPFLFGSPSAFSLSFYQSISKFQSPISKCTSLSARDRTWAWVEVSTALQLSNRCARYFEIFPCFIAVSLMKFPEQCCGTRME